MKVEYISFMRGYREWKGVEGSADRLIASEVTTQLGDSISKNLREREREFQLQMEEEMPLPPDTRPRTPDIKLTNIYIKIMRRGKICILVPHARLTKAGKRKEM